MKQFAKRGLALLMVLVMSFSLLAVMPVTADAAGTVTYRTSNEGYIYNWGKRGETAHFHSPNGEAFYTGNNTYEKLSALAGSSNKDSVPNSPLYTALQAFMAGKQTWVTSYDATKNLYKYTDCQNNGDPATISSFYSGAAIGPEWDSSPTWNREHTWPNSKGSGDSENDIMMLRPTAQSENGSRGNTAYGESAGFYNPNSESNNRYDLRGDVARIALYVYVRWGNSVNISHLWGAEGVIESKEILLKWMAADPVDTWELGRNDSVQSMTGTRNVFVDYPELAFTMFGEQIPADLVSPSNGATTGDHTHVFDNGTVTPPSCSAEGYTTYACTVSGCTYSYKADYTPATEHSFKDGTCTVCGAPEGNTWSKVELANIKADDVVTITMTGSTGTWALYNANGEDKAPTAVVVKVNGNTMTSEDVNSIAWNIENNNGKLTFYPYGSTSTWLYSTNTNNGTRVGTDANKTWVVDSASGYLKHEGTNRYLGVYTSNPDWRSYNNTTGNTAGQTLSFWKLNNLCNHSYTSTVTPPTCTEDGYTTHTCGLCGHSYTDNIVGAPGHNIVNGECTNEGCDYVVVSGSKSVKIYYPAGSNYITSTASGNKLKPGSESEAAVWTMVPSGDYYTFSVDGKYLTAGATGNSLTLSASATDYSLWVLEDAGSGNYYLRNANAAYQGKAQYVEYYNNLFTTYGFSASNTKIYTFQLKEVATEPECDHTNLGAWEYNDTHHWKTCECGEKIGEAQHNYVEGLCECGKTDPNYVPPSSGEITATITFDDASKRTELTTSKQVWQENGVTVTNDKAASSSNVADYKKPARFYAGSSLTIEYPGMTKIEVACNSTSYATALKNSITDGTTVTVNGKVVTITLSAAADSYKIAKLSAQVRVDSMTIYAVGATQCDHTKLGAWEYNDTHHWKTCECGEKIGEAQHNYVEGLCECGKTDPSYVPPCDHTKLGAWEHNDTHHWKTCECGEKVGEAQHTYKDGLCECGKEDPNYVPPAVESWVLVTDASTLTVGDKIVIVASGYNKALSTTQNGNNRGSATVTKSGDTVTFGNDTQIIVLEAGKKSGTWAFNVGNGYLYAASSSKNYLRTEKTLSNNSSWSVTISSKGVATIKAQGTNSRNWMRFNSGNSPQLFSCYSSGQADISIYKLTVPACDHTNLGAWEHNDTHHWKTCECGEKIGEAQHSYTSSVTTEPGCTTNGVRTFVCTCGHSYTEDIPGGHNYVNGICSCGARFSDDAIIVPPMKDDTQPEPEEQPCTGGASCVLSGFVDVSTTAWYHDGMHYCVTNGLLNGLPGNRLAPGLTASRGQIITMMWRMAGSPAIIAYGDFNDVESDTWYTSAVRWAAALNISGGYGDGTFGVADDITREQVVTMLYRYAGSPAVNGNYLASFPDADKISSWAKDAMNWAVSVGLINGTGAGQLAPAATATRAEVASILMRFELNVVK